MCGRYFIRDDEEDFAVLYAMEKLNRKFSGDITPGSDAPVITGKGCAQVRWGVKGPAGLIINARSETSREKRLFSSGRELLLPASGFYEWNRSGTRYVCVPPKGMYMAGLLLNVPEGERFVVLTMPSAGKMDSVHDRMPVFIPKDCCRTWLSGGSGAAGLLGELEPADILPIPDEPEQISMFS